MTQPDPVEDAAPPRPSMLTDDAPFVPGPVVPDAEPVDPDRPDRDAHKDVWVAYAIQRGMPSYEAWAKTKPDLMKEL